MNPLIASTNAFLGFLDSNTALSGVSVTTFNNAVIGVAVAPPEALVTMPFDALIMSGEHPLPDSPLVTPAVEGFKSRYERPPSWGETLIAMRDSKGPSILGSYAYPHAKGVHDSIRRIAGTAVERTLEKNSFVMAFAGLLGTRPREDNGPSLLLDHSVLAILGGILACQPSAGGQRPCVFIPLPDERTVNAVNFILKACLDGESRTDEIYFNALWNAARTLCGHISFFLEHDTSAPEADAERIKGLLDAFRRTIPVLTADLKEIRRWAEDAHVVNRWTELNDMAATSLAPFGYEPIAYSLPDALIKLDADTQRMITDFDRQAETGRKLIGRLVEYGPEKFLAQQLPAEQIPGVLDAFRKLARICETTLADIAKVRAMIAGEEDPYPKRSLESIILDAQPNSEWLLSGGSQHQSDQEEEPIPASLLGAMSMLIKGLEEGAMRNVANAALVDRGIVTGEKRARILAGFLNLLGNVLNCADSAILEMLEIDERE